MKLTSAAALAATAIFASALVNAQGPSPRVTVDPTLHPNLAAAQDLSRKAFERILEARKVNDWDNTGGHLGKAMDDLIAANEEIAASVQKR
jgi:hypothetical protein